MNNNCLEDIVCPICGHTEKFKIAGKAYFSVTDDGTEDYDGVEWDEDAVTICCNCGHSSYLYTFKGNNYYKAQLDKVAHENMTLKIGSAEGTTKPLNLNDNSVYWLTVFLVENGLIEGKALKHIAETCKRKTK